MNATPPQQFGPLAATAAGLPGQFILHWPAIATTPQQLLNQSNLSLEAIALLHRFGVQAAVQTAIAIAMRRTPWPRGGAR
ncbi:hypothetical protein [Micromonospora sp. NPDC049679]|uniref:hypothetical protein n=1 Tax=Micromonospora sp. NPDC049679 TaxID=3155920 RepID=UPI0033E96FCD